MKSIVCFGICFEVIFFFPGTTRTLLLLYSCPCFPANTHPFPHVSCLVTGISLHIQQHFYNHPDTETKLVRRSLGDFFLLLLFFFLFFFLCFFPYCIKINQPTNSVAGDPGLPGPLKYSLYLAKTYWGQKCKSRNRC